MDPKSKALPTLALNVTMCDFHSKICRIFSLTAKVARISSRLYSRSQLIASFFVFGSTSFAVAALYLSKDIAPPASSAFQAKPATGASARLVVRKTLLPLTLNHPTYLSVPSPTFVT